MAGLLIDHVSFVNTIVIQEKKNSQHRVVGLTFPETWLFPHFRKDDHLNPHYYISQQTMISCGCQWTLILITRMLHSLQ